MYETKLLFRGHQKKIGLWTCSGMDWWWFATFPMVIRGQPIQRHSINQIDFAWAAEITVCVYVFISNESKLHHKGWEPVTK